MEYCLKIRKEKSIFTIPEWLSLPLMMKTALNAPLIKSYLTCKRTKALPMSQRRARMSLIRFITLCGSSLRRADSKISQGWKRFRGREARSTSNAFSERSN